MSRKKEVRRYLRSTMEVKLLVRNTWLYLGFWALFGGSMHLLSRMWQFSVVIPAIFLLPYLLWFGIRYTRIMAKAESYCFYRAQLDSPHSLGKWFYFTVALDEEDGTHTVVDTHVVCHCYGMFLPALENCLNQNVGIAYNPETKMVVVAG